MPAERYYIPQFLIKNEEFSLEGIEFHHMANVMRSKSGDVVELVNGNGMVATATILKLEKKKAILLVTETDLQPKSNFQIILAQAIPRLNRLEFIVEKGTELGMTELWLFPGERSERKSLSESQIERLQSIMIAALKQCGRLYLPQIKLQPAIAEWPKTNLPMYFGDVSPSAPLLLDCLDQQNIIFCTGPESGFTNKEEARLTDLGARGVKLHRHILRTDTASISALALITHQFR